MLQKRIAVISYHTCPLSDEKGTEIGGMNIYVLELSKQLAKKGFTIDIYTRAREADSPKIVQVAPNLRVIHLVAGPEAILPKKQLRQYIPEFTQALFAFIEKESLVYDLLNAHYYYSGIIGMEMKKRYQLPLTMTFHTLALMKNLVARNEGEKEDLDRIETELRLTQESDHLFAASTKDAQYITDLYNAPKDKVSVLTPGIDAALFYPTDKEMAKKQTNMDSETKTLLFVGRIEPLKGVDVLLYAIKILLTRAPHLRICLAIVGGDTTGATETWSEELKRLEKIRRLLGIEAAVKFIGQKKHAELPLYYNAADIVVMPSHYEAFGMTALEAMACGTPVITTDATGVSGLLDKQHASLVTSANNPIMLASKIKHLLCNQDEYQKVSREVYAQVQDLSWEKVAERFAALCI
ncbi:MAG: glycosyltransferase [Patescibacteria group bacterium]